MEEFIDKTNRQVFELLPIGIFYKDMEGIYHYCNKEFSKIVGYPKKSIIGKKIDQYLKKGDLDVNKEQDDLLIEKGKKVVYTLALTDFAHERGSKFFKISKSLVKDKEGKNIGIVGTVQDIHDEQVNFERLELALNGASEGIWDWEIAPNKVYYSPRWKSMLGYKEDELENSFAIWEELLHPEDLPRAMEYIGKYNSGEIKGDFVLTFRMKHKDGHYIHILSKAYLVKSQKGKPVRMIGTHSDFSDFKNLEESLKWYQEGFESSSNSMALVEYVEGEPKISRINKSFLDMYGYEEKDVIGKNPRVIKSKDTPKEVYVDMWKKILDPKTGMWLKEIVNTNKEGEDVPVILSVNSIFDEEGQLKSFVAHHTDISELRKTEEDLSRKVRELEEFNNLVVNRELKMIELKEEIADLKAALKAAKKKR